MNINVPGQLVVLALTTFFGGVAILSWLEYQSSNLKKRKGSLGFTKSNDGVNSKEHQFSHPSTRQYFDANSDELHNLGLILCNFSNQEKEDYKSLVSHYPISSRMLHVLEALEEMKKIQSKTESLLQEQIQKTNAEIQRNTQLEKAVTAESKLREDMENNAELYKSYIDNVNKEIDKLKKLNQFVKTHIANVENCIENLLPQISDENSKKQLIAILNTVAKISDQIVAQ